MGFFLCCDSSPLDLEYRKSSCRPAFTPIRFSFYLAQPRKKKSASSIEFCRCTFDERDVSEGLGSGGDHIWIIPLESYQRKRLETTFFLVCFVVFLALLSAQGASFSDSETAVCNNPLPAFVDQHVLSDHAEVEVQFTCEGVMLAGTFALSAGPYLGLVWMHILGEEGA
jgi:hypothetical protein